ncbi:hypothetical protein [Dyella terrae]|nr:hypothetical protein [Dyella terrae]TBR36699.1 hypothetical protein EYV96_12330 [Dyella terrae]
MPLLFRIIFAGIILVFSLQARVAWAQATLRCDACTEVRARQLAAGNPPWPHVYVMDMVRRQMRHFYRQAEPLAPLGEVALTPQERDYWQLALRYYDGNHGYFSHLDHWQIDVVRDADGVLVLRDLRLVDADRRADDTMAGQGGRGIVADDLERHPSWRDNLACVLTQALLSPEWDIFDHLARHTGLKPHEVRLLFGADHASTIQLDVPEQTLLVETRFIDGSSARWVWRPQASRFAWAGRLSQDGSHRSMQSQVPRPDVAWPPVLSHLVHRPRRCRWGAALSSSGYLHPSLQHSMAHMGCPGD